jgi:hypothetical protein
VRRPVWRAFEEPCFRFRRGSYHTRGIIDEERALSAELPERLLAHNPGVMARRYVIDIVDDEFARLAAVAFSRKPAS